MLAEEADAAAVAGNPEAVVADAARGKAPLNAGKRVVGPLLVNATRGSPPPAGATAGTPATAPGLASS
jgi:hypothetical protein